MISLIVAIVIICIKFQLWMIAITLVGLAIYAAFCLVKDGVKEDKFWAKALVGFLAGLIISALV